MPDSIPNPLQNAETPHLGGNVNSDTPTRNVTEIRNQAASTSALAMIKRLPEHKFHPDICDDLPIALSPFGDHGPGYDLAAVARMTTDELQNLACDGDHASPEMIDGLLFLRQQEREPQSTLENASEALRISIVNAQLARNELAHLAQNGQSAYVQAHGTTKLIFALGELNATRRSEKAVHAYENQVKGARKARRLSAPWQAVWDDFHKRECRQTITQAFHAYQEASGASYWESFRPSYYKKRKDWQAKV